MICGSHSAVNVRTSECIRLLCSNARIAVTKGAMSHATSSSCVHSRGALILAAHLGDQCTQLVMSSPHPDIQTGKPFNVFNRYPRG
jgi:hypothetical protein